MSLGPPFDDSGLGRQRLVGAGVVLLLIGAVAWVLFMSGRTLGRGILIHVELPSVGALHTGAKVRIAGREVGEIRSAIAKLASADSPFQEVDLEVFIARDWAADVHANSQFFVASPSVLGESYLEIGPPAHGEAPGPALTDGARVRAAAPPDLDRFFVHAEASLREAMALLADNRPALDELLTAGDSLLATLSGLPADRGQLRRIVDQAEAALGDGRALIAALREAGAAAKVRAIASDLDAIADRAGPELSSLGARLDRALTRIDGLRELASDARRSELASALTHLRHAVTLGTRLAADVHTLAAMVAAGQGTIGGLLQDRELFDDLHETHRILKSQPLRFLLKTVKP